MEDNAHISANSQYSGKLFWGRFGDEALPGDLEQGKENLPMNTATKGKYETKSSFCQGATMY